MLFMNMFRKYYAPETNGEESGAGGNGGNADDGKTTDDPGKKDGETTTTTDDDASKKDDGAKKDKDGLSDSEAKLLKDLMKHKDTAKTEKAAREALEAKLKEFEGIDPKAVREMLTQKQKQQEEELEKKGQWETLKANMAAAHQAEKEKLEADLKDLREQISSRDSTIDELTIGSQFSNSGFIKESLNMTPSKARVVYGSHFELVDGVLTGHDKPRGSKDRSPLVDASGNALPFDKALSAIVEADPDRDELLKSKSKTGSNSGNSGGAPSRSAVKIAAGDDEKSSVDKIRGGLGSLVTGK